MKNICIAGKNQIAIDAIIHLLDKYKDVNLFFLENKGDFGVDGWQPSYKKFCLENKIRSTSLVELYEMDQLVFISLEYDQILRTAKFKSKNLFNIHFSLLPKYKGMYTSAMPLLNGEKSTGVTLHLIDDGIDTGDIIDQIDFPIEKNHTARDVYFNYLLYGSKLFVKNIDSLLTGRFKSWPQSSHNSSYYSRRAIDFKSLEIDINKSAFEIHNQFRAYSFKEFQLPKFQNIEIKSSEIINVRSYSRPGTIIQETKDFFDLSTIDYIVRLFKENDE